MKKLIIILIFFLTIITLNVQTVSADIGPKATAEIHIKGIEGDYYFELLVFYRGEVYDEPLDYWDDTIRYDYYKDTYPERLMFYQDEDGFAACTFYNGPPCVTRQLDDDVYKMIYFFAPREFKVAVVTEDDVLIVSEKITRTLYEAKFVFDLTGVDLSTDQFGVGEITEELPVAEATTNFLLRIVLTVGVELLILAFFMYRKRSSYLLVGVVNVISQTALSLGIMLAYYLSSFFGALAIFVIGELLVFTFEIVVYSLKLKEKSVKTAVIYGLVANTVTLLLTFVLMIMEVF